LKGLPHALDHSEVKTDNHKVAVQTSIAAAEVATADVSVVNTKNLKYVYTPEPIEQEDVLNILKEFSIHFEKAITKLGIRSWDNLKLSQIANALAKLADDGEEINIKMSKEAKL
jgi:hypothetical protein